MCATKTETDAKPNKKQISFSISFDQSKTEKFSSQKMSVSFLVELLTNISACFCNKSRCCLGSQRCGDATGCGCDGIPNSLKSPLFVKLLVSDARCDCIGFFGNTPTMGTVVGIYTLSVRGLILGIVSDGDTRASLAPSSNLLSKEVKLMDREHAIKLNKLSKKQ